MVDLDRFKQINDDYGHLAGDRVLVEVARRLEESTRSTDLVARFGGDEFAILLAGDVSGRSVDDVADRIRRAVARPIEVYDRTVLVGVSIGSAATAERGIDATGLIERADVELYRIKAARPSRSDGVAGSNAPGRSVPGGFGGDRAGVDGRARGKLSDRTGLGATRR